jgi:hypothetical protein
MSAQEEDKFYSPNGLEGLNETHKRLSAACVSTRSRLKVFKSEDDSAWSSKRITLEYMQSGDVGQPEKKVLSEEISNLLVNADVMCKLLEELKSNHESFTTRKINDERKVREAERKDKWILWRDQLVRWTLGVCMAVILNSAFVYASDDHCVVEDGETPRFCIKVPIKDWIPH